MTQRDYPDGWSNKGDKGHLKDAYNEYKNYYRVFQEHSQPAIEQDVNEAKKIEENFFTRFLHDFFPNYFIGESFKIEANGVDNDFSIQGGIGFEGVDFEFNNRAYIHGMPVVICENITYKTQDISQPALAPPPSGTREDIVYIDAWLKEVDYTDDEDIEYEPVNKGFTTRLKMIAEIKVAQGGRPVERYIDSNGLEHYTAVIAKLERDTGNSITSGMITDLRSKTNTFAYVQSSNSETFALSDGSSLSVNINEAGVQTITFLETDFNDIGLATADEVVKVISRDLVDGIAYKDKDGKIFIRSNDHGINSSVEITGGSANTQFGFSTSSVSGEDGNLLPTFFTQQGLVKALGDSLISGISGEGDAGTFTETNHLKIVGGTNILTTLSNDGDDGKIEISVDGLEQGISNLHADGGMANPAANATTLRILGGTNCATELTQNDDNDFTLTINATGGGGLGGSGSYKRIDKVSSDGVDQGDGYFRFDLGVGNEYMVGQSNPCPLIVFQGVDHLHEGETKDWKPVGATGVPSSFVDIAGPISPNNNYAFYVLIEQETGISGSGNTGTFTNCSDIQVIGGQSLNVVASEPSPANGKFQIDVVGSLVDGSDASSKHHHNSLYATVGHTHSEINEMQSILRYYANNMKLFLDVMDRPLGPWSTLGSTRVLIRDNYNEYTVNGLYTGGDYYLRGLNTNLVWDISTVNDRGSSPKYWDLYIRWDGGNIVKEWSYAGDTPYSTKSGAPDEWLCIGSIYGIKNGSSFGIFDVDSIFDKQEIWYNRETSSAVNDVIVTKGNFGKRCLVYASAYINGSGSQLFLTLTLCGRPYYQQSSSNPIGPAPFDHGGCSMAALEFAQGTQGTIVAYSILTQYKYGANIAREGALVVYKKVI